jgi:hypothetical protein
MLGFPPFEAPKLNAVAPVFHVKHGVALRFGTRLAISFTNEMEVLHDDAVARFDGLEAQTETGSVGHRLRGLIVTLNRLR